MLNTLQGDLAAVRNAISKEPFSTGTCPLTDNTGLFFFRSGCCMAASCIDLADADDASLQVLLEACEPPPFGVDNEEVLDETYCKAWKMDSSNFATRFDVVSTGIVEHVCGQLMQANTERKIRPEMYKLDVYGPGSFFKAHRDTPPSEKMFGSLVIFFPIPHEGGTLRLRHKGKEWDFDCEVTPDPPSVSYIAFYSDVEHEVSMVTAGYQVTLTYNLYFDDPTPDPSRSCAGDEELALRANLSTLIDNRNLLPDGGYLGFGLDYMYPIGAGGGELSHLINALKGSDAMIKRVLDQLNLRPQLKIMYDDEEDERDRKKAKLWIMLDDVDLFPTDYQIENDLKVELCREELGGIVVCGEDEEYAFDDCHGHLMRAKKMLWITPQTTWTGVKSSYVVYGNEPLEKFSYGNVCLVVEVPASSSGKRVKGTKRLGEGRTF